MRCDSKLANESRKANARGKVVMGDLVTDLDAAALAEGRRRGAAAAPTDRLPDFTPADPADPPAGFVAGDAGGRLRGEVLAAEGGIRPSLPAGFSHRKHLL